VNVEPDIRAGFYSIKAVVREAQAELDKADNQKKLAGTGHSRSELFVWLDFGDGQIALSALAEPAFDQEVAQLPTPALPSGVTAVWVASAPARWPQPVRSLLVGNGTGWRAFSPPALNYDDEQIRRALDRLLYM
jgi:soluble lytic murein transglycosylase-like protein